MKTLESMRLDSVLRFELWDSVANDPEALADRNKTRHEAELLRSYFEGKVDALTETLRISKTQEDK